MLCISTFHGVISTLWGKTVTIFKRHLVFAPFMSVKRYGPWGVPQIRPSVSVYNSLFHRKTQWMTPPHRERYEVENLNVTLSNVTKSKRQSMKHYKTPRIIKKHIKLKVFHGELKLNAYLCIQKVHRRLVLRHKKTPWKQTGALSRQYFWGVSFFI